MKSLLLCASLLCLSMHVNASQVVQNDVDGLTDDLRAARLTQSSDVTLGDVLAQPNLAFEIAKRLEIADVMHLGQTDKATHAMLNDNAEFKTSVARHVDIKPKEFNITYAKTTDYFKPWCKSVAEYKQEHNFDGSDEELINKIFDYKDLEHTILEITSGEGYDPGLINIKIFKNKKQTQYFEYVYYNKNTTIGDLIRDIYSNKNDLSELSCEEKQFYQVLINKLRCDEKTIDNNMFKLEQYTLWKKNLTSPILLGTVKTYQGIEDGRKRDPRNHSVNYIFKGELESLNFSNYKKNVHINYFQNQHKLPKILTIENISYDGSNIYTLANQSFDGSCMFNYDKNIAHIPRWGH